MRRILRKILAVILRIGISIFLLIILFRQVDTKSLFETIRNVDKRLLLLALAIFSSNYILSLFRWEMLLKALKIHLPLKRIITSFSGGIFFSLFLPSTIGGDFMRSVDLAALTKKPRQVVATVFLDRLSGYTGLVILAVLAVFFGWPLLRDRSIILAVGIITVIFITVLLILFNQYVYSKINKFLSSPVPLIKGEKIPALSRIRESIKNLHQEMYFFRNKPKTIIANVIISLILQVISPVTFYIIALSLGVKIDIIYFFIFLPIISAITLLPISIGGLGLRDATTIFFFAKVGVSKDFAFAMSLLSFLGILIYGIIGGIIYVLTVHHRRV